MKRETGARALRAVLDEFMLDDPLAQDGELEPVGVDGRPATIVPIRYD